MKGNSNNNNKNGDTLNSARRTSIKITENKDQNEQIEIPKKVYQSLNNQQSSQSAKRLPQLQQSQPYHSPQSSQSQLSSREHDFTYNLMMYRKKASEEAINKAFNFISDMNNKDQVNRALLMVNDVRDRQKLVEKMVERREQIEQAREMQAINSMGPLFTKIKEKFLSAVREDESPEKQDISFAQKTISSENLESANPQNMSYVCMGKNEDTSGETYLISSSPSPSHSNQVQQQLQQQQLQQLQKRQLQMNDANTPTSVASGNANMMALNIFASKDVKDDGEKDEEDKKIRHTQLLGYLQRDQRLVAEDKNKIFGGQINSNFNGQSYPNLHRNVISSSSQGNIKSYGMIGQNNTGNTKNLGNYKNLSQSSIDKQQQTPKSSHQSNRKGQIGNSNTTSDNKIKQSEYYISSKSSSNISAFKTQNSLEIQKSQLKIIPSISARRSSQLVPQRSSYLFDFIDECESKRAALNIQNNKTIADKNNNTQMLQLLKQSHSSSCSYLPFVPNISGNETSDNVKPTKQKRLLKRLSTLGDLKNSQQLNNHNPNSYINFLQTQKQEGSIEQTKKQSSQTINKTQQQNFYLKTRYIKDPVNMIP